MSADAQKLFIYQDFYGILSSFRNSEPEFYIETEFFGKARFPTRRE